MAHVITPSSHREEETRMSTQTVTCPHCQTLLRSDRPVPAGTNLRCPDCKTAFTAPDLDLERDAAPRPATSLVGAPLIIAATVSLLLGGAIVAAAVILSLPRSPAVKPDDQAAEAERKRLEEERKKLDEARAKLDRDAKRDRDYTKAMTRAHKALGEKRWKEAEQSYQEALDLIPGDKDANTGLVEAQTGRKVEKSGSDAEAKVLVEVNRLLGEAKKAVDEKQWATAVRLLTAAQQIAPANRPVLDKLLEAQKGLDNDTAEKKKLADFKKYVETGKAALAGERFPDAIKEFIAALQLMPDDPEVQQLQKQAQAKLAAVADKDKRQKAFDDFLGRARRSKDAKRYNDALAAVQAALRIDKDDREANRLKSAVEAALKQVKADNAKILVQADAAVKLNRPAEAKRLLDEAMKNWPEDDKAEKALKDLDRVLAGAVNTQQAYRELLQAGVIAMAANRYADAVKAYTAALELVPTDIDTQLALKAAQIALNKELKIIAAYNLAIKNGTAALGRKAWSTAIKAFKDALKLIPDDPVASDGLSQARYGQAMAAGRLALAAKQKAQAIKAFNAALNEKPGDFQATSGLRAAQLLR
jgi:tetratricopeptide (TPR) repeat protein